jgi:ferredoxin-NADP reductase
VPSTLHPPVVGAVTALVRRPLLGLLDALSAPHGADRYLDMAQPAWSRKQVRATVRAIAHPVPGTVTVTLRPNGNWAGFEPGQFVELSLLIDGVRHTRCYSPANSAHERDLELTARVHPGGKVSTQLDRALRPGQVVHLSAAQGEFTLVHPIAEHLLFVSAGTGITPLLSMVRTLLHDGHRGAITLVQYAATEADVLYRHELAALALQHSNLKLVNVYTDGPPATRGPAGLFQASHLAAFASELGRTDTYACGPPALLEGLRHAFDDLGHADRLHLEAFTPPPVPADLAADAAGEVSFTRSGISAETGGETLLELAEANGLRPAYGCRMGICHTCTTPMSSGAVRDVRTGRVCTEAGTRVQLCVSVPLADTALDL